MRAYCPSAEPIILSLILPTVSLRLSAHLFTMLLIVPVEFGMINTPERISWVRFILTAPTVFNATDKACRFSQYCTAAFTSEGNSPLRVSPCSMQNAEWKFQCLMFCYIYRNNRIDGMAFLSNAGSAFTHLVMRAFFTCGAYVWRFHQELILPPDVFLDVPSGLRPFCRMACGGS